MKTTTDPNFIDSLVPGHVAKDLPIINAIREFRLAVLDGDAATEGAVGNAAFRLLSVLHFAVSGEKIPFREIKSVSVNLPWERDVKDRSLLIDIVDVTGYPWKYRIESGTYLSTNPRLAERIEEARDAVRRCKAEVDIAEQGLQGLKASLNSKKLRLENLENSENSNEE